MLPLLVAAFTSTSTEASFSIVYTGASYGIGSGRYAFELPERIQEAAKESGDELETAIAYHGVAAQGHSVLVAGDRRVETLVEMLREGSIICGEPRAALSVKTDRDRLLYAGELDRYPPWIAKLEGGVKRKPYEARLCKSASRSATLYSSDRSFEWKLEAMEIRVALHLTFRSGREAELIGIPEGEPSRRFHLLDQLAHKENTIYVDTGSFVDGASSVRDGALSVYRPLGFKMLERLDPAALVPGENELVAGLETFLAEAREHHLDYVATNWTATDPAHELPEVVERDVPVAGGVVKVAFLGILDPRLRDLAAEGVTIDDPVETAERVTRALRQSDHPPDLIILLTSAGTEITEALEQRVDGADLILGDKDDDPGRVRFIDYDLRPDLDDRRSIAATLPLYGIPRATLRLYERAGTYALRSVRVEPHSASESHQPDPETLAFVTKTRAEFYPQLDHPLIASPGDGPLARLSPADWRKLTCEAVLGHTDADVVILPRLPPADRVPGPATELMVVNRLAVLDRLEEHFVPGTKVFDLLRQAGELEVTACGAAIGAKAPPIIRGRLIDPEAIYRVVSTDRARTLGLGKILEVAYSTRAFDARGPTPLQQTLRTAVLEALRLRRNEDPKRLLIDSAGVKPSRWFLRFTRLSFRVERFHGANDGAFNSVPETLATSPSSLSLTSEADVALSYDGPALIADLRLRSQYSRLVVGDAPVQEPSDDLRISSSLAAPGLFALPLGAINLMPFTEVLLDSEFTRIEQGDVTLPRQMDLSLTVGLAVVPISFVKVFRLGGFALRDLARTERPTGFGGRAEWFTQYIFGPELRFETTADATVFASTSEDSSADLRFKSLFEGRLVLPLARFLDVGLFGRAFVFSGRAPETEQVRASYLLGFALDLHGVFRL